MGGAQGVEGPCAQGVQHESDLPTRSEQRQQALQPLWVTVHTTHAQHRSSEPELSRRTARPCCACHHMHTAVLPSRALPAGVLASGSHAALRGTATWRLDLMASLCTSVTCLVLGITSCKAPNGAAHRSGLRLSCLAASCKRARTGDRSLSQEADPPALMSDGRVFFLGGGGGGRPLQRGSL